MDETIDLEDFFQLVSSGSVDELKEIVIDIEPEEAIKIANTVNNNGETPLIVAIQGNHYKMIEYLVKELKANIYQFGRFIWKECDYAEVPPIFAAILCDMSDEHFIIDFLIDQDVIKNVSPGFVDAIVPGPSTLVCQTDMLKLLGAAYILNELEFDIDQDRPYIEFGMQFWTKALSIGPVDRSTIPPMKKEEHLAELAQKVFENASEFTTEEELEDIYDHPRSSFLLQTQALLIIQRVMSELQPDPHPFFLLCLIDYGDVWFLEQDLHFRTLDVVILILKEFQATKWENAINYEWPFTIVEGAYVLLDCCFHREKRTLGTSYSKLPFSTVMEAFQCFADFHTRLLQLDGVKMSHLLKLTIQHNASLIVHLPKLFNLEETGGDIEQWLYCYIKATKVHPGVTTLLHEVCRLYHREKGAIQLLLKTGADPEATDGNGGTPLHVLSLVPQEKPFNGAAVHFLLDAGCHLDRPNARGETPLHNFACRLAKDPDPSLNSICKTVLPLKCYSAQAIRRDGITFKNQIPATLQSFVEKH